MPLPAALLARLKQRGIVNEPKNQLEEVHEEVIAEDYDASDGSDNESDSERIEAEKTAVPLPAGEIVPGCPNKNNIYHDCTVFCREKWGQGKENPSPRTERRYQKLIRRYPLPDEWEDVWEPGLGCYYFWNTENDEVSWLPPNHPKAKVTMSAAKLKQLMKEQNLDRDSESNESESEDNSESGSESDSEQQSSDRDSEDDIDRNVKRQKVDNRSRERFNPRNRGRARMNAFDPMDPASYSDTCPRGKWSDGLGGDDKGDH